MTSARGDDQTLAAYVPQTARIVLEIRAVDSALAITCRQANPAAAYWTVCATHQIARSLQQDVSLALIGGPTDAMVLAAIDEALDGRKLDVIIVRDASLFDQCRMVFEERSTPQTVWLTEFVNAGGANAVRASLVSGDASSDGMSRVQAETALKGSGLSVLDVVGLGSETDAATIASLLSVATALGAEPADAEARLKVDRWLVRACPTAPQVTLTVVALALRKVAGVTEARVDYPLKALASLPGVTAVWGDGTVTFPPGAKPGILLLHRQFLHAEPMIATVEKMVSKGWIVVSDIDDDPHHWREYVDSDFRAFRGVHAVTVSTNAMADLIRQWNPEVTVFPNHLPGLAAAPPLTPKTPGRLRVFFGALNRSGDWPAVLDVISRTALLHAAQLELVVVHDEAFFEALPDEVTKSFHPTLPHARYMEVLASCDVALLPLADTPFNRLKSDLKLIECAGAGVVPICSRVVYDEHPEHASFAVFADMPSQWGEALTRLVASPAEVRRRREAGLFYVKNQRLHSGDIPRRKAYFMDLVARRGDLENQRQRRIAAMQNH